MSQGLIRGLLLLGAALLLQLASAAPPTCYAPYKTPQCANFTTPCYAVRAVLDGTGCEIREYLSLEPTPVVTARADLPNAVGSLDEAVLNGVEFILCYFEGACSTTHVNVFDARTVPVLLRPPQKGGDRIAWQIDWPIAASAVAVQPYPAAVPPGESGVVIKPFGTPAAPVLVAVQTCFAPARLPTQADFTACEAELLLNVAGLPGWEITAGLYTPTYAYYTGQNSEAGQDFPLEVWASVRTL
jgi:hypothetical protein